MIDPSRLGTLRQLNQLTQAAFADRLGVAQSFISRVERGEKALPEYLMVAACTTFNVPLTFFDAHPVPALGAPTYRKSSTASAQDAAFIDALFVEAARAFYTVSAGSGYRETELPMTDDPEEAASAVRMMAGLGPEEPVRNVTRLLERLGVGVVSQLAPVGFVGGHEGVSRPSASNSRPLVALSSLPHSGDRQRFSLAHEFGHLLFDQDLPTPIGSTRSPEERRAHAFAGALLLPATVARREISESLTLHSYLRLKSAYGISVGAAIARGRTLGLITETRYRSLRIQLSSAGWNRVEPVGVEVEQPALFSQAIRRVYPSAATASSALGIPPSLLQRWAPIITPNEPDGANVISFEAHARRRR
ncbi:helix-turn-helix domain-containing protein [Gulosibacter hominis]|uniref:helix-turn-helix domain-containing protein n=1 Tax=Gulosibacter hominis TaxID=2770504 RepID=UPI00191804C8|nr:XRE family transcriptional regulator [Gulosibacter hominis]